MYDSITNVPYEFGPGLWFAIHIMSKNCKTERDEDNFVSFMKIISESMPCEKCRDHCKTFMKTHRMSNFKGLLDRYGMRIGLFMWSNFFHNSVNLRLGKPILRMEDAYILYDKDNMCKDRCGI